MSPGLKDPVQLNELSKSGLVRLKLEQSNTECKQEGVGQSVNWSEDGDVLGHHTVPQEAHDESHDHDPHEENKQIVQKLLAVTGVQNALHIVL